MHLHRQPDQFTCGAACLVTARMAAVPAYADALVGAERFDAEVWAGHRLLTSVVTPRGLQVPWPRGLGTPPWALARALDDLPGLPGRYRVHPLRCPASRAGRLHRLLAPATRRAPLPVYVGSRTLPRHVVLVLGSDAEGTGVYDPAAGTLVHVTWRRWVTGPLGLAGWSHPWAVLTPHA